MLFSRVGRKTYTGKNPSVKENHFALRQDISKMTLFLKANAFLVLNTIRTVMAVMHELSPLLPRRSDSQVMPACYFSYRNIDMHCSK